MSSDEIIQARYITSDLAVGDFDNASWAKAQTVPIDHYWSGQPAPANRHAAARILWSTKALHIRFICKQGEPLVISDKPQTAKKTIGLWDRDVCEIFIARDAKAVERYFEFECAPTGEWLDVAIHWSPDKRESDWNFQSHLTTATRVERDRVTIAMRIPWNGWIRQPQKGERWRVNLFRCVGKDPDRGYLSWQPTRTREPNFHVPSAFGLLLFQ